MRNAKRKAAAVLLFMVSMGWVSPATASWPCPKGTPVCCDFRACQ
jgi:hypothetical protein